VPICGWPKRSDSEVVRSITRHEGDGEYTVREYADGLLELASCYGCPTYPGTVPELLAALEDRDHAGFRHSQAISAYLRMCALPVRRCRCGTRRKSRMLMPLSMAAPLRAQSLGHQKRSRSLTSIWARSCARKDVSHEEHQGLDHVVRAG
jgi:hypothetical protein